MSNNTAHLAPALAYRVAAAFDGDDMHAERVRSLAAILSQGKMSSRNLVRWVHENSGHRLSQSTVSRAQGVAQALLDVSYPLDTEAGEVTQAIADLVRVRTLAGATVMSQVAAQWTVINDLGMFADYVNDEAVAADEAKSAAAAEKQEEREIPAADGGVDDGSGAGQDMTGEAIGGGLSAATTADKMAAQLRALAGDIESGRVDATDDLARAAAAVLNAIVTVKEREGQLTAEPAIA